MKATRNMLVASVAAIGLALAGPAFGHAGGGGGAGSAGGGASGAGASGAGSDGSGSGAASNGASGETGGKGSAPACQAGFVYKRGQCQRAGAGVLPDRELYRQGRALALAGYYTNALPILEAVARTDDAMVYTMRGYATRKLGRFDEAMALYDRALAIEPNNVNTHEYIGEAYVSMGKVDLARVELAKVQSVCGKDCEQYQDLARAIRTGETE